MRKKKNEEAVERGIRVRAGYNHTLSTTSGKPSFNLIVSLPHLSAPSLSTLSTSLLSTLFLMFSHSYSSLFCHNIQLPSISLDSTNTWPNAPSAFVSFAHCHLPLIHSSFVLFLCAFLSFLLSHVLSRYLISFNISWFHHNLTQCSLLPLHLFLLLVATSLNRSTTFPSVLLSHQFPPSPTHSSCSIFLIH